MILTTSGRKEVFSGVHVFAANAANPRTVTDTFRIALFTSSATINASTQTYSVTNEVAGGGYTAGGVVVTPVIEDETIGGKVNMIIRWADIEFTASPTFTFRHAILYNATPGKNNRVVAYETWDSDRTASGTTYSIGPQADDTMSPIIVGPA